MIRAPNVTDTYKIVYKNARLSVRRVELYEPEISRVENSLARGKNVNIYFTRTDSRAFQIPKGMMDFSASNVFTNRLPQRVFLGVQSHLSTGSGAWSNDPMLFPAKQYNVSYVQFYADDLNLLNRPYEPEWNVDMFNRSYMELLRTCRCLQSGKETAIAYNDFKNDYGLFGLDLSPDKTDMSESRFGSLGCEIKFSEMLEEAVSVVVIGEFKSVLCIDDDGDVNVHDL